MSRVIDPQEKKVSTAHPPESGQNEALPTVISPKAPTEILAKLASVSKMGRLPGFVPNPAAGAFQVSVLAGVFDHDLRASMIAKGRESGGDSEGEGGEQGGDAVGGTRIAFELVLRRRLPIIMIVVLILTVWPGLPVTDSMLRLYFTAYHESGVQTWWWYLPLVVISMPPMWKQFQRSRREAHKEAEVVIKHLGSILDGRLA